MIRSIVRFGDRVLEQTAEPVTNVEEARDIINDLFDTLDTTSHGVGLAAPQIGLSKQIFVVQIPADDGRPAAKLALINPVIEEANGESVEYEGCLSVPWFQAPIKRSKTVRMRYTDINGGTATIAADGLLARVLLHEEAHLRGELFFFRLGDDIVKLIKEKLPKLEAQVCSSNEQTVYAPKSLWLDHSGAFGKTMQYKCNGVGHTPAQHQCPTRGKRMFPRIK